MRCHFWRGPAAVATVVLMLAAGSTQAEDTKPKTEKKPPSVCVGLDIPACAAKSSECYWKQQITTKQGKIRKAHCRIKRQHFAKKDAAT
jgi:hypothetical protein